jgi:outer membrane protein OmpA-like peptidoglycan-associated protein
MFKKKIFSFLLIFMFGCIKRSSEHEKSFYAYLQNSYNAYGNYKRDNYDWKAAKIFYKKANLINKDEIVLPEKIIRNNGAFVKNSDILIYEEFESMKERMMLILETKTAKEEYPEETANMQFYFDCWLIESEYYERYGQIARCKQGFIDSLAYLEFKLSMLNLDEIEKLKKELDKKDSNEYVYKWDVKNTIYFDFDSSVLNELNTRILVKVIREFKTMKNDGSHYIVKINGHTDRAGKDKYNEKLSKLRSNTIKHYLIKNGIPENLIQVNWLGKIDPSVITDNNHKEELNRRVTITIIKKDEK